MDDNAQTTACTECGTYEFPKRWNCADCIAAADEQIAAAQERFSTITTDISKGELA